MFNSITDVAVLGFGIVGSLVLGNRAAKMVAATGGSETEQLATAFVVGATSAVVMPITAVAGLLVTGDAAYKFVKANKHKTLVEDTKVKFHELKAQAAAKFDKNEPAEEV